MSTPISDFSSEAVRKQQKRDITSMSAESNNSTEFPHTQDELKQLATDILGHAKKLGATGAMTKISEGNGRSVSVRRSDLETIKHTRDRRIGVTVFVGNRSGTASTSEFSETAMKDTVAAAYHIARFTAEDSAERLPEEDLLEYTPPDLDLHHPWHLPGGDAAALARCAEDAAFAVNPQICNSDGASVSSENKQLMLATSNGFMGGYASSRHTISCVPIAGSDRLMQRDRWHTSKRHPEDLATPEAVGRYAAERALARVGARRLDTCKVPVLFEAPLAVGLLNTFAQAVTGGALYRKTSLLVNSLGRQVFSPHVQIVEDPHVPREMGSAPFDGEGVGTRRRSVVLDGVVAGYFLSTYSARKLGMRATGNAGGPHRLTLRSTRTQAADDFHAMLNLLDTGLLVTTLLGQGVNILTGDYSRGAAGFWVEHGVIQYPVEAITVAGTLQEMFRQIVAIGADSIVQGPIESGSILIEQMTVAC